MDKLTITCAYCAPPDDVLYEATCPDHINLDDFRAAWKAVAPQYESFQCGTCGAQYQIEDDLVPPTSGGLVQQVNVSRPVVSSLNATTGPREGGNVIFITGDTLEIGALVVKFGGEVCPTVDTRTIATARVIVPPATYTLNVLEQCHKLTLTVTSGSLAVDESITTTAGSTGTIRLIDGTTYWVAFANLAETLTAMVGTSLTGGGSGGTATVDAAISVAFTVGENLSGLTTVAQATIRSLDPLRVFAPTAGFAPDELVQGSTSGALVKLTSSPAYSGLVDVSVENEYGQRLTGSDLVGAYTYA